jgi:hypothetical protein
MRTYFGGIVLAMMLICASARAITVNELIVGKTESGPNHALKDLKGKVVLVVFWGTH